MSSTKDARVVRTSEALQQALLALLERKPLEEITIREIAAKAGVHYATFFRHHATKESLLDAVAADQIDRLVELTLPVVDNVDSHAAFTALCEYVEEHRKLWTSLLTGGAANTMRDELLRLSRAVALERATEEGLIPADLAVVCSVSTIVETLAWWLAQPPEVISIERLAKILDRLVFSSANELASGI